MEWNSIVKESPFHLAGLLSLCIYSYLAWLSQDLGRLNLLWFFILNSAVFLLLGWVFFQSRSQVGRLSIVDVVVWAIAFRIVGGFGQPIFEDDFYRYLWDGYRFFETGDPFTLPPSHFFGDPTIPVAFQRILDGINYPDIPTVYAPTLQLSFLAGYWLTPGDLLGLKVIYGIADVILIVVLYRMVPHAHWVLLYAWNPLVIKEIAFTAHPDGFGVLFLVLACFFFGRKRLGCSMVCLGLSVCAKPFAWFVVPFMLWKTPARYLPVFVMTIVVLYLPFVLQSNQVLTGLLAFGKEWQFNASVFYMLYTALPVIGIPASAAKPLSVGVFLSAYALYFIWFTRHPNTPVRYDVILAGLLFFSPVVNAWYWLWVLPFAVLFPSRWAWVASFALLLSYVVGINIEHSTLSPYQLPIIVLLLEYGVIFLAMFLDYSAYRREALLSTD